MSLFEEFMSISLKKTKTSSKPKSLTRLEKADLVARLCVTTFESFKNDDMQSRKFLEGIVAAEGIFRVPTKSTGLISEKALELKMSNKKYIPTKEHFYGRRGSADLIFEQLQKGKGIDRIRSIILSRSRVHLTTAEENNALKAYDHLYWRDAYEAVGIKLVPNQHRTKAKKVMVDSNVYDNATETAKAFKISVQTVYNRINKKDNWNYLES